MFLIAVGSSFSASAEDKPWLDVVDRSLNADSLYLCTLSLPSNLPFDMIVLSLKDRMKTKVGEVMVGMMDVPGEDKRATFFLNHELVKNSVVEIAFPLDDDKHENIRLVVGDHGALRRQDGKTVKVPIE